MIQPDHQSTDKPVIRWRRKAFSLVELAVVTVIGALLFGLAAPSLDAVRDKSRHAVCLERLGQIATAGRIYATTDPHAWAIPAHRYQFFHHPVIPTFIGAYEWGGKSGVGRPGSTDGPSTGPFAWITSRYGTRAGFGPATRPLNPILFPSGFRDNLSPSFDRQGAQADTHLELPVYRCPGDNGPPAAAHCPDWLAHPKRSSYDHFGNSFAANVFMIGPGGGGEVSSNSPYLRPISRVPNPARTILYEENIGRWAWACRQEIPDCTWIGPGIDPGPSKHLRGWHAKAWTYNRAFVDTHAESQAVYIEGTENAQGYANHYYNEVVFDDPEQQAYYRCAIVRGDGWQKDTLPADPIPTGLQFSGGGRASYEDCVGQ